MAEDQVKEKLKQGLLKKIKESYHLKKDYQEALSYINYYISNIGTNDEISMYKSKVEKKLIVQQDTVKSEEQIDESASSPGTEEVDEDIKTSIIKEPKPTEDKADEQILESEYLVNDKRESAPPPKKKDEKKLKTFCQFCGNEIEESVNDCPHCGTSIH